MLFGIILLVLLGVPLGDIIKWLQEVIPKLS